MKYNEKGEELPDSTPVTLTVRQRQAVDKYQLLKAQILAAVTAGLREDEQETFEESLDFEVEDDEVPMTSYERAELEVDDMRRTANYVKEEEYKAEGVKRFMKPKEKPKEQPATPPAAPPAKPQE